MGSIVKEKMGVGERGRGSQSNLRVFTSLIQSRNVKLTKNVEIDVYTETHVRVQTHPLLQSRKYQYRNEIMKKNV